MNEQVSRLLTLAEEEFQTRYVPLLDARLKRSEVLGSVTLQKRSAALFYDKVDNKFTLLEKVTDQEEATIFDAIPRQQWGRNVLLFGHATSSGGYIAHGHGSLTGKLFYIKLSTGHHFRFEVDPTLPCLASLYVEPSIKKEPRKSGTFDRNTKGRVIQRPNPPRSTLSSSTRRQDEREGDNDENEDFSAADLRRLRGEAPMHSKKRKY